MAIILLLPTAILSVETFICVAETIIILIFFKTISVMYRIKWSKISQNESILKKILNNGTK